MENNLDMALSRRKELLEIIAAAADEIAEIDRRFEASEINCNSKLEKDQTATMHPTASSGALR